jgi:4-hydroxybenzoate polyprenyltransferase
MNYDRARSSRSVGERLLQYALLVRLDRPIGIFLLLWPALWALWIAGEGRPQPLVLFVFIAGAALMRSAGCAINDYADRKIDPLVNRTRQRPLATGTLTPGEALWVFAALACLAFLLVLLLNSLTIWLALVGLALASVYPFSKRFTYIPQVFLGLAFGWAVPMAYAAQTGELSRTTWLLYAATVLWAVAYDTIYAMVDREDDLKVGVKSTAILFGDADRAMVGFIQLLLLITLVLIGQQLHLGFIYFLSLGASATLFAYQHYLIRTREPELCMKAFLNNNWAGLVILAGLAGHYLLAV